MALFLLWPRGYQRGWISAATIFSTFLGSCRRRIKQRRNCAAEADKKAGDAVPYGTLTGK